MYCGQLDDDVSFTKCSLLGIQLLVWRDNPVARFGTAKINHFRIRHCKDDFVPTLSLAPCRHSEWWDVMISKSGLQ